MKHTTVRLDEDRRTKMKEIKNQTGRTLTEIVERAIDKEHKKL